MIQRSYDIFLISAIQITKACHGNNRFQSFRCPNDQVIVIVNIFLVADECDHMSCCLDKPHCLYLVINTRYIYRRILNKCHGQQTCTDLIPPSRQDITCPSTGERHMSDYVQIEYLCISGTGRVSGIKIHL